MPYRLPQSRRSRRHLKLVIFVHIGIKVLQILIMSNCKVAESYQQNSSWQRDIGTRFVQNEVKPCPGDVILDLGCGTGELSAYLAELVGQEGKVIGVDPDKGRLKLAQESHMAIKNLTFVEGSTSNFPGMALETYDIIFSNHALHWVVDKQQAFKNMFNSLKPAGKIALHYIDRLPTTYDRVYRDLNPENLDRLLNNVMRLETKQVIEQMCTAAGFNILKSYYVKMRDRKFENGEMLSSFFWATTHGVFDPKLVTEERLARFCAKYSSGEAGEIKLCPGENDFHSALIAVKPA